MQAKLLAVLILPGALSAAEAPNDGALSPIFDGKSLEGWKRANEPGHGSGCLWEVRDGAIAGTQQYPGAWGILGSPKKYGDFELSLEVKAGSFFDAGILVRSTLEGHGYLVRLCPAPEGDVGGIAGLRIGDFRAPARDWKAAWKKDDWNEIRVAVKGQPPEIRTWLNGRPMSRMKSESTDPRVGPEGHVVPQLGGKAACFHKRIFFRNIRIGELKEPEDRR